VEIMTADQIEEHAVRLERIAAEMIDAGIGGHPTRGHSAVLKYMASCMRADAAHGKVPYSFDGDTAGWSMPSPIAAAALAKLGIVFAGAKIPAGELDAAIAKSKISVRERFQIKTELAHAGVID
jgi:hypothetical protein